MAATDHVFDWIDDENDAICDIEDDHSASTKAPLILITDHPDAAVESSSALSLQWHVHHRRGSVEAKLINGWSTSSPENHGRLFYSRESSKGDGFTLVDFDIPTRVKPCSHPGVDCPLCDRVFHSTQAITLTLARFLPGFSPPLQEHVSPTWERKTIYGKILRRGGHVNDRDGLTDMTMLHYASKSGAGGVGDPVVASETVQSLIEKSADFAQKCRWTDMLPLHYATFFDIVPVINILLNASGGSDADAPCKEFDNGTPLHIACSNLCLKAAKCLLQHKANPNFRDASGRKPRECLPPGSSLEQNPEMQSLMLKMQALLLDAENSSKLSKKESLNDATLHALGLSIGDDVIVSGKSWFLAYDDEMENAVKTVICQRFTACMYTDIQKKAFID
eukprot:gene10959-19795_t